MQKNGPGPSTMATSVRNTFCPSTSLTTTPGPVTFHPRACRRAQSLVFAKRRSNLSRSLQSGVRVRSPTVARVAALSSDRVKLNAPYRSPILAPL